MRGMDFRFLGPLEVANDGRLLPLGGPKQRALLATLLVRANEVVSREQAIDSVWEDAPPERAVNALQVHVHGLRRALGHDRIAAEGAGYLLRADAGEVDARRFAQLYDEGRTALELGDAPRAVQSLASALALWRGEPLADLSSTSFVEATRARFGEQRLQALELRIEAELALDRGAELIAELQELVVEHPFRERLRGQLMLALYRSERQNEALDVYARGRRTLADELGLEPGVGFVSCSAILRQDPSLRLAERRSNVHLPAAEDAARRTSLRRRRRLLPAPRQPAAHADRPRRSRKDTHRDRGGRRARLRLRRRRLLRRPRRNARARQCPRRDRSGVRPRPGSRRAHERRALRRAAPARRPARARQLRAGARRSGVRQRPARRGSASPDPRHEPYAAAGRQRAGVRRPAAGGAAGIRRHRQRRTERLGRDIRRARTRRRCRAGLTEANAVASARCAARSRVCRSRSSSRPRAPSCVTPAQMRARLGPTARAPQRRQPRPPGPSAALRATIDWSYELLGAGPARVAGSGSPSSPAAARSTQVEAGMRRAPSSRSQACSTAASLQREQAAGTRAALSDARDRARAHAAEPLPETRAQCSPPACRVLRRARGTRRRGADRPARRGDTRGLSDEHENLQRRPRLRVERRDLELGFRLIAAFRPLLGDLVARGREIHGWLEQALPAADGPRTPGEVGASIIYGRPLDSGP